MFLGEVYNAGKLVKERFFLSSFFEVILKKLILPRATS
jgi:hypothetical protein